MPETPPQFPLQLIVEEEMSSVTDTAIRQLLCECFPADDAAFAQNRAWHESEPAFSVVCPEGDGVTGHVAIVLRTIQCGDAPVLVSGIQNMCVTPTRRGTGLAQALMCRAVEEVVCRGIEFGLLFCEPDLESLYRDQGWRKTDVTVTMADEFGHCVPIPDKNIAMLLELTSKPFPSGRVDLAGRDW